MYRHRKKVWLAVQIGCIPLAPITGAVLLSVAPKIDDVAAGFAFGGFLSVVVGMFVFQRCYCRCPICDRGLGREARYIKIREFFKGHCKNCGADFPA